MLKKTVKYKDFNDEETEEDLFFNLTRAELVELEMSHEGGLSASMQRLIDTEDGNAIMKEMKNIILMSYGKKSLDGKRFVKNAQLREEFESSKAYDELFISLVTDADQAAAFINGIVPSELLAEVAEIPKPPLEEVPKLDPEVITKERVDAMTDEEFKALAERLRIGDAVLGD